MYNLRFIAGLMLASDIRHSWWCWCQLPAAGLCHLRMILRLKKTKRCMKVIEREANDEQLMKRIEIHSV